MAKHSCPIDEDTRQRLGQTIKSLKLHEDQSQPGRHRCVFCAYLAGLEAGLKQAEKNSVTKSYSRDAQ